ncbi:unnamed protein product [Rotaria sordida]|uniref:Uncharacterized protein n=1 Tax=Rotaria sordida TaxID=392033 RepID=A0A814Q4B8_9BILA|nr:unnamed protein product [Rotaria sordida]
MMTESTRSKTNPTPNYLFRNVTELTLTINQQWPIKSIEHLSTIVNLSNLQKVHLNFGCDCKFAVSLDVEMDTLFKRAWNLRSIQITCNDSERMKLITLNAICLKLPSHIKRLDTDIMTHKLDLNFLARSLSCYNREQRLILVQDLEYEHNYKIIDMVLEQLESPMRSCALALLFEPIELYVHHVHDLLFLKFQNKSNMNISRNSIETDLHVVQSKESLLSKLIIQLLEGQRNEDITYSVSAAKVIAKRLSETSKDATSGIDSDIFINFFTHDAFAQLSAVFDIYEDRYGCPIQVAIQHQCENQIEVECFQDIVEYTRSPAGYHAKILRQALDQNPVDYITLIRISVGHEGKDLSEIKLEYSKVFDETLDQTIQDRIDILEIKILLLTIITIGDDTMPNDSSETRSDKRDSSSLVSEANAFHSQN